MKDLKAEDNKPDGQKPSNCGVNMKLNFAAGAVALVLAGIALVALIR